MPYKYKRVCPICQRPWVVNFSSHLEMVHDLNANERADYLKRAILCASTPSVHARVPTTTVTAKLKNSRQRLDRRIVQSCQKSSNKTPLGYFDDRSLVLRFLFADRVSFHRKKATLVHYHRMIPRLLRTYYLQVTIQDQIHSQRES